MLQMAVNLRNIQITSTGNGAEVDLGGLYVSPGGGQILAVQSVINAGVATDAGGVTGAIQASATTVDSDFVTIGTFPAVSDVGSPGFVQVECNIPASARYIRHRAIVTGVPKLGVSATVFLTKRVS